MLKAFFAGRLRTMILLLVAFLAGLTVSSVVVNAQYMRSAVNFCQVTCPHSGAANCPDICSGVPAGLSCTCSCTADNLGGPGSGECTSWCDYGNEIPSYCP